MSSNAPRSRKRGRHGRAPQAPQAPVAEPQASAAEPTTNDEFLHRYRERSEQRNEAVRAGLVPLQEGERPWPILVSVAITTAAGIGELIAFFAGAKIGGSRPNPGGIVLFAIVMLACAIGMWRMWYQAVLGFMVLLAIVVVLFALFLVEASNLLGVLVPAVFVFGGGFLFWKLVRVLSRMQMPERPSRS